MFCDILSFPSLDSLLGLLAHDIRSTILGDQGAVLLAHHQHGDPLDSVLLLQIVGESRVMLHTAPVAVGLLHVRDHVLGGPVARHEDDLQVVRDLSVEVTQHGGELPAGRTPVGGEVVEDEVLNNNVKTGFLLQTSRDWDGLTLFSRAFSASTLLPSALIRVAPFRESILSVISVCSSLVVDSERCQC